MCQIPILSIVIVNWNTSELLIKCLCSIKEHLQESYYDVFVVDNASSDGSSEIIEDMFPWVKLIKNNRNVGFARANNQAMFKCISQYVCLLNSDTEILADSIQNLVEYMNLHQEVVACSPALRLPNGTLQSSAGGFRFNVMSAINHFLFLSKINPLLFKGMYLDQTPMVRSGKAVEVDWLCGACLVVRMSAIEQVGALDDSFFMYAEDVEWCDRLRMVGKIKYLPFIEITHHLGASTSSEKINLKWLEAMFRYYRSRSTLVNSILFRFIIGLGLFVRYLIYSVLSAIRFTPDMARKVIRFRAYFLYVFFNRGGC